MALDPIWKQQLCLVTFGNEYLNQKLAMKDWQQHSIFYHQLLQFYNLNSQHLLAQHFQIWLEGLKRQGVTHLSLHLSSLLAAEKNPNANIELLETAHFIVSHQKKKKTAWLLGKELAEWDTAEQDFVIPPSQQNPIHIHKFWCFELDHKFYKNIEADLKSTDWSEINTYIEQHLFNDHIAKNFIYNKNIHP